MIRFWATISGQWLTRSFKTSFARPFAGVSCPRAERRPQRAGATHRSGATWPMECTSSAAGAAAASVSTAAVLADRCAALHGLAEANTSMTCTFSTARRREGEICMNLLGVSLEEFLGFCLGGLMRSDDLT